MTVRARLSDLARGKGRIEALEDRLAWLRERATMAGTRYSQVPGGGTRRESGQERFIADITETEAELRAQVTAQICAEREAERAIFALEDPLEREVLRMRYLNGWMMTKVAQKLNYSERQIYRLQESGLQHLEKSWPKAGQGSPAAPATAPTGAACP